jgi:hypothetical protein
LTWWGWCDFEGWDDLALEGEWSPLEGDLALWDDLALGCEWSPFEGDLALDGDFDLEGDFDLINESSFLPIFPLSKTHRLVVLLHVYFGSTLFGDFLLHTIFNIIYY